LDPIKVCFAMLEQLRPAKQNVTASEEIPWHWYDQGPRCICRRIIERLSEVGIETDAMADLAKKRGWDDHLAEVYGGLVRLHENGWGNGRRCNPLRIPGVVPLGHPVKHSGLDQRR